MDKWMLIAIIVAILAIGSFFIIKESINWNTTNNVGFDNDNSLNSLDICNPSPGYTEQEWKEHMSHHPDIYKDCLD